jgi:hypothetical protein
MERAAQLRAQGHEWGVVAEHLGLSEETVAHYPTKYPPFDALVDWYREQLWQEEIQQLVEDLQPAALEALLAVLRHDSVGDEGGPSWGHLVQAARAALQSTGFTKARQTEEKLNAQEDVTGEPGERVNVHGADSLDDLDDDELTDRIDKLEEIVHDD